MTALPVGTRVAVSALMVLTAALFWAASAVEKRGTAPSASVQTQSKETSEEAPAAAPEGSSAKESQEASAGHTETPILGINLEAAWVPYAVIIETVVVVVALFLLGYPILYVVILLAVAGAVLDIRELVHQLAVSRPGLAVLVATVALTRVAAAAVALTALLKPGQSSSSENGTS